MGNTPDEKRPLAFLEQKILSLNANTTADKKSGFLPRNGNIIPVPLAYAALFSLG